MLQSCSRAAVAGQFAPIAGDPLPLLWLLRLSSMAAG